MPASMRSIRLDRRDLFLFRGLQWAMTESRIDDIEVRCAYLERATQELSDVLHRQQQQLDQALSQIEGLRRQVEAVEMSTEQAVIATDPRAEVPPHY